MSEATERKKLLDVRGLKTYFDVEGKTAKAVDGVDFHIYENEVFGLVGESGCGKSVTALSVLRLIPNPPGWIKMSIVADHYHQGRYDRALAEMRETRLPDDFREPLFYAAIYGQLGLDEEAGVALDELRAMWGRPIPDLRQELIERHAYGPEITDRLMQGLEKAGAQIR